MSTTTTDRFNGLNGGVAFKAPCRLATTENITLSGEQTIDGVASVAGDRVLVKDQSVASENGVYDVSTSAWQRAADFDGNGDIVTGTMIRANLGDTNADTFWRVSTTGAIIIGTSSISFAASNVQQSAVSTFMAPILLSLDEAELKESINAEADVDFLAYSDARAEFFEGFVGSVAGATINLGAQGSSKINVLSSGASISSLGTSVTGNPIYFMRFADVNTLVNGANLILPTGANITTAAGDTMITIDEGFNVFRVYSYERADGSALAGGSSPNTYQASPANPAAAGSTTHTMAGLAGAVTPNSSGEVMITISGYADDSGASTTMGVELRLYYGTGTAPSNGGALTGTAGASALRVQNTVAGSARDVPFSTQAIITGLAPATTYWIDLSQAQISGTVVATLTNISISAFEIN